MRYYFTFGSGQPNQGCYHIIEAPTAEDARQEMIRRFGQTWANQYESAEEAGSEEWHLKEIK